MKGGSLLSEADTLEPNRNWPAFAVAIAILAGSLKGLTLFRKSCHANLSRIDNLEKPRIWEFFRPRFFLLLSLMILVGTTLSRAAHGDYVFLFSVAILDLSIATALLTSSYVFWKRWVLP